MLVVAFENSVILAVDGAASVHRCCSLEYFTLRERIAGATKGNSEENCPNDRTIKAAVAIQLVLRVQNGLSAISAIVAQLRRDSSASFTHLQHNQAPETMCNEDERTVTAVLRMACERGAAQEWTYHNTFRSSASARNKR